jgi:hypothetical protein
MLLAHKSFLDKKRRDPNITSNWEATSGFEPLVQLLQSRALPLGYSAAQRCSKFKVHRPKFKRHFSAA